jgi:hypothetical protein
MQTQGTAPQCSRDLKPYPDGLAGGPSLLIGMLLFVLLNLPTLAASGADENPQLKQAREKYAKALSEADTKLLENLDKTTARITEKKMATEQKVAMLDVLKAEKKRFEDKGLIPLSEPMWPFAQMYLSSVQAAQAQLRKSYSPDIEKALKAKKEDVVKDLRTELSTAIDPKIVARWRHQPGNGPEGKMRLYSNGKIGEPDGQATWTLDNNGTLTLRWPNPKAPGNAWVDVCKLSGNGSTYSGANQNNMKISGIYIVE